MKVGIKIFSSNGVDKIRELAAVSDFIELMPIKRSHIKPLLDIDTKWTIHAKHIRMGVNLCDKKLEKSNLKHMNDAIYAADKLNAKFIVTHAGQLNNKNCSTDQAIKLINKINDSMIIIENQNFIASPNRTPEALKDFKKAVKKRICFDFSHAQIVSVEDGLNYSNLLKEFMKLKPAYFHVCDGRLGKAKDLHWNLGKGDFPIKKFKKMMGSKPAALEVEYKSSIKQLKKQVDFLKR